MVRRYSQFLELVYFLVDIVLLNVSFLIAIFINFDRISKVSDDRKFAMLLVAVNLIWFMVTTVTNYYKSEKERRTGYEHLVFRFLKVLAFQVMLTFTYLILIKGYTFSRLQLGYTYIFFTVLDLGWRITFETYLKRYRARGGNYRRIIVIGTTQASLNFVKEIQEHNEFGYRFFGYFDDPEKSMVEVEGSLEDVQSYCRKHNIDEVYFALHPSDMSEYVDDLLNFCNDNLVRFRMVPEFSSYISKQFKKVNIEYYGSTPILSIRPEPLDNLYNRLLKRLFDIAFALLFFIIIGWWLFPIIALFVKLSSTGPVFFIQKRSGEGNEEFWCYKFRTMKVNAEADTKQATKGDPRITRVGAFLRKTNLDELPQFINVLLGDMSVVGPRPHMLKHTEEYSKIVNNFMVRHFVKPGITGAAQANGYRGDTTDPVMMEKRVQYDLWYLENWSFWLDVKIVFLTVWSMLKGNENAF
ncbi:MAG TPA: undecaprenyl-phosphate glucose phosphotransferase [Chitinophagales bacterium]|nr:undecaprenyl-phosphate glucose phosphotransferase [Chitinophagales bacterium]HMX04212.1 undecaprenyl-phosphate glucose phosphotransferase [Chitinophagales bacterium]HMZ87861.1 undecaprenyl-phosphate glucose phosphotransferase [Chitinophagales bacterium]HNA56531.1 undecaprenyl-phosphate glucose phosphotransferase [Chitinophagales bacterium]HNE46130.1 undecaprenyl-phosphate glucose phosphotransferase [Chitinophagales bacterium]